MVSYLMFNSLSNFEFISVFDVRVCSNYTDLHETLLLSQHPLLKRLPFSYCVFLTTLMKINGLSVKVTQAWPTLCDPMDCTWNSPGQNIGLGSRSLLQGIFPTQGSNPGLLHCRQILYHLSHQESLN